MGIFVDRSGLGRATLIQVHVVDTGTTPTPTPIPFTHTVPSSMTIGQTYTVSFNGGYNVDQSGVTYTLTTPYDTSTNIGVAGTAIDASKVTGILPGENIIITWYGDTSNGHTVAPVGNYIWGVTSYSGQTVVRQNTVNFTLMAASVAVAISEVFNSQVYTSKALGIGLYTHVTSPTKMHARGGSLHVKCTDDTYEHIWYNLPIYTSDGKYESAQDTSSTSVYPRSYMEKANVLPYDALLEAVYFWDQAVQVNSVSSSTRYLSTIYCNSPRFYKNFEWTGNGSATNNFKPFTTDNSFSMGSDIGMVIARGRDTNSNWFIWHRSFPNSYALLNSPSTQHGFYTGPYTGNSLNTGMGFWDPTKFTSLGIATGSQAVGTIGNEVYPLNTSGVVYTAHVFAHDESVDGVIRCGKFIHDGSDGNRQPINLGWKPQRLFLMASDGSSNPGFPHNRIYDKALGWTGPYPLTGTASTLEYDTHAAAYAPPRTAIAIENTGFYVQDMPSGEYAYMAIRDDGAIVTPPVLSGTLTITVGSSINAGETRNVTLSGITADHGTVTYNIAESGTSYLTFSKSSGITANEAFTVTASSSAPNGSVLLNIAANTSLGASNGPRTGSHNLTIVATTQTPTMSGTINHTIPSSVTGSNNYNVQFSGKSTTSGTVNYGITVTTGSQYVSFSKTAGISNNETVVMSIASNAPNGGSIVGSISANTTPVPASNGPDSVGFTIGTSAAYEPDPSFSGFSNTLPANTEPGQSYQVTFSGTTSSNGRSVWYTLQPQTGLSFSKTDNINPGESITMTVGSGATGTLSVTVYANTTKTNGSTFTQNLTNVQTTVQVPITIDWSQARVSFTVVNNPPQNQSGTAQYNAPCNVHVMGVTASNGSYIKLKLGGTALDPSGAVYQGDGMLFTSQPPYVEYWFAAYANDGTTYAGLVPWKNLVPAGAYPFTADYNYSAYPWPQTSL